MQTSIPFLSTLRKFLPNIIWQQLRLVYRGLLNLNKEKENRISIKGKKFAITDSHWNRICYNEIFVEQIYMFKPSRSNPLIIDCGANVGLSVLYFKNRYPESTIIAFEPDGKVFDVLERNVNTYGLENVTLIQKAVWDSETTVLFQPDGSVGGMIIDKTRDQRTIEVETVRLQDYLCEQVDFLKIDIEGAEYEVIRDCKDELAQVEYLFVEYHGRSKERQKLQEILALLQKAGFRYHIQDAYPIAHPFIAEERIPRYDLQLNIFAFRNHDWKPT